MADVLEDILVARRRTLKAAQQKASLSELELLAKKNPVPLDFRSAIHKKGRVSVIAEMKRKSPSAGVIVKDYRVANLAAAYKAGGAHAISVLTEPDFFGGEVQHLQEAKKATGLPVLRKDFIFDPYQVIEARAFGADGILLIADMLDRNQLKDLVQVAARNGIQTLVEVFTRDVVDAALKSGSSIIGINTRNLRTLEMVPNNVEELSKLIPKELTLVAESGIKAAADIERLKKSNVAAVLIGESILKQVDPAKAVRALVTAGE